MTKYYIIGLVVGFLLVILGFLLACLLNCAARASRYFEHFEEGDDEKDSF